VRSIETAIERRSGTNLVTPQMEVRESSPEQKLSTNIFEKQYLKRTGMMWISFACILFIFYAVQTYTPTVFVDQGYGFGNAFLLTSIIVIASVPGKYVVGYTLER